MSVRKRAQPAILVSRRSVLTKVIIGLIMLAVVYAALTTAISQGEQLERIMLRRGEIQKDLDKAEKSYKTTRDLYESMGSDAFIEKIAREKLGMLMPGEILFVE